MDRLHKTVILILVAGIPAAAPPFFTSPHPLCFTAGSITYQLSALVPTPDYRVKFDNGAAHPDLRVGLVDRVESADFALVDDVADIDRTACKSAELLKTVKIVADGASDVTISLTRDLANADFKLFVHSARFNHRDAAALLAVMRHHQPSIPNEDIFAEGN